VEATTLRDLSGSNKERLSFQEAVVTLNLRTRRVASAASVLMRVVTSV